MVQVTVSYKMDPDDARLIREAVEKYGEAQDAVARGRFEEISASDKNKARERSVKLRRILEQL